MVWLSKTQHEAKYLASRQRWFLGGRLAHGPTEAWTQKAGWSGESQGAIELSGQGTKVFQSVLMFDINSYRKKPQKYLAFTFFIFPGVGVPPIRLLDGVLIIVPYSISSCICLVFFICYFPKNNTLKKTKQKTNKHWQNYKTTATGKWKSRQSVSQQ